MSLGELLELVEDDDSMIAKTTNNNAPHYFSQWKKFVGGQQ